MGTVCPLIPKKYFIYYYEWQILYVFVMHKFMFPKLILGAGTNKVCDLISGGRNRRVAHSTPTDQKPSIGPIFVHLSAGAQHPKEKPARGGWGILNKRQTGVWGTSARWGKGQSRGAAVGASRGRGSATRGDATTSWGKQEGSATRCNTATRWHIKSWWHIKRLQHDEKPRNNQPSKWEATARGWWWCWQCVDKTVAMMG